jgi:hypothetical protein
MKAVLLSAALLLLPAAAAAQTAAGGVPSAGTTLTYADGTVVTMNAEGATNEGAQVMNQSGFFWGGSGVYTGVYTPEGLADVSGLAVVWRAGNQGCSLPGGGLAAGEVITCGTTRTLTFTFSRPVTDAVLHLHNIGGLSTGHTFYSSYTVTSPSTSLELLSRGGNFQVTGGNVIGTIEPVGTDVAVPGTNGDELNLRPLNPVSPAAGDYYGTGSGSVRVRGTYTELTFTVTFFVRAFGAPAGNLTSIDTNGPEGIAFQFTVPPASTAPVPPSLVCSPDPVAPGSTVTCAVAGGDPDIDILWNATYSGVFAGAGVRLGVDGTGQFSFVAPCAAAGQSVSVELVEWTRPIAVAVADGACRPVPTRVPAGEGPAGADAVPLALFGTAALSYLGWTQVGRRSGRRFASEG